MAKQWFVVEANKPSLARYSIAKLGIEVYLPECVVRVRHGRRTERVRKPLLFQYMFVRFDLGRDLPPQDRDETWKLIFSRRGVETMICAAGGVPKPVPDAQIDQVRQYTAKYEGVVLEDVPLTLEQVVQIIDGPFGNFTGVVKEVDPRGRVMVEANLFGRATPVELDWAQVAPVAA